MHYINPSQIQQLQQALDLAEGRLYQNLALQNYLHSLTCKNLKQSGWRNIPIGNPYYTSKHDRDSDGLACKS